jgi:NAD(P)-dependent dehydrogenase (short-subunit alcohol dehydrogenase family)
MDILKNRTALVTGATSGIGRAVALAFAAEGAHVAVAGRHPERGRDTVAAIEDSGGRATFVPADLGLSVDAVRKLASDATEALGHVDILVNNAGIFPSPSTADTAEHEFDAIIAVNVRAPFFLVQELAPAMAARRNGVIINLGSWVSTVGLAAGGLYSASKATVEQLTRSWAAEFGPSGVRVNSIAPGITRTEGNEGPNAEFLDTWAGTFPAGRLGEPHEVAAAAVWLASDAAAYVHGTTLLVDGGALTTRVPG